MKRDEIQEYTCNEHKALFGPCQECTQPEDNEKLILEALYWLTIRAETIGSTDGPDFKERKKLIKRIEKALENK